MSRFFRTRKSIPRIRPESEFELPMSKIFDLILRSSVQKCKPFLGEIFAALRVAKFNLTKNPLFSQQSLTNECSDLDLKGILGEKQRQMQPFL